MSYSTCRPNRTVGVRELAQEVTHFFCVSFVDTHSSMCHGSGKSAFYPCGGRQKKRMLPLLKRGRDFHKWSGVRDPRRCVLMSADATSLHKACFSVQSFTGGVYLPKKDGHLTHKKMRQTPPRWRSLSLSPVVEGSSLLGPPVLSYCSILFPF